MTKASDGFAFEAARLKCSGGIMQKIACSFVALALGACASSEVHYYTLSSGAASPNELATGRERANFDIVVLPVHVPMKLDRLSLVTRAEFGRLDVLDNEHWASPLADEVRSALVSDLTRDLGVAEVSQVAHGAGRRVAQVSFDVQRLDSTVGRSVTLEAQWSARFTDEPKVGVASCHFKFTARVDAGYAALVVGYQQAMVAAAAQISSTLRDWDGTRAPSCAS